MIAGLFASALIAGSLSGATRIEAEEIVWHPNFPFSNLRMLSIPMGVGQPDPQMELGFRGLRGSLLDARETLAYVTTHDLSWPESIHLKGEPIGLTMTADRPVEAVVHHKRPDYGRAQVGASRTGSHLIFPLVGQNQEDHSFLGIINPDPDNPASVELRFEERDGRLALSQKIEVAAGGQRSIDTGDALIQDRLSGGFNGLLRLLSDRPISASVVTDSRRQGSSVAYEGLPIESASSVLLAPIVRSNFWGDSAIAFFNPGREAVRVSIRYRGLESVPNCAGKDYLHGKGAHTVAAGSVAIFPQGNIGPGFEPSNLPQACAASARIEVEGGAGLAVVKEYGQTLARISAYAAIPISEGSRRIAFPLFLSDTDYEFDPSLRNESTIYIYNPGERAAKVSVHPIAPTYYGTAISGCGRACQLEVPAQSTGIFHAQNPADWRRPIDGAALLESDQDVVAVAVLGTDAGVHDNAIYGGIPYDEPSATLGVERQFPLLFPPQTVRRIYLPRLDALGD
jgi:hypothetical protein